MGKKRLKLGNDSFLKMKRLFFFVVGLMLLLNTSAQVYWNANNMNLVKLQLDKQPYKTAYYSLIKKAESYILEPHLSVVDDKEHVPASGNIHDYMSIGRYTWPDSTKANGLPYIGRDGHTNPEYYEYDREVLLKMVDRVKTLTLAWYFSGNKKYASTAVEQIRIWFLKKDTYMNPNMFYGQIVKGYNSLNSTAVLDGAGFVDLLDALYFLEKYRTIGWRRDQKRVKKWFVEFLNWIETSDQGIRESKARDNTGTAYDLQRLAYNLYCGREEKAQEILDGFVKNRLLKQIDTNGVQIEEIKRASSFGYSVSNITVMMNFIMIAYNHGLSLSSDAKMRFYSAIDFLTPYLNTANKWPYQEISDMKYYRKRLCFELYRIACNIDKTKKNYLKLYETYGKIADRDIYNLLH